MSIEIAIVYHSRHGHTAALAHSVAAGVTSVAGVSVYLCSVAAIDWARLDRCAGLIFGAPTYMGSASAEFKQFMDASSGRWLQQSWRDKLAAGFTNSYGLSGDKLNVLIQFVIFAAQHAMIWIGQAEPGRATHEAAVNRLGSHLGVMAQSDNAPAAQTPPSGDHQTAFQLGERMAQMALRWMPS